ncbi:LysR family transcriptional regulator [Cognatishimia sp. SS12]|uniref:LysR family transcriptional regulator n=1 Tax=Cognatishimia sp. SS12 TaxID=2979465 RepID=UPI00232CEDE7|nr:LysR family transcriptional regulator [Cognatishimia sp. SS12]MDC0739173.1 LysR family transcriptional regulator [Cognatishimia sp. SS12]
MKQPRLSPDWNHIRAFLATAEHGSLSAAAIDLGLTQPTLSRQVAALEENLGVLLFERVGRSLELTQAGLELLDHTKEMGAAASKIALTASGQSQAIEGEVRITAADIFSAYFLTPALTDLRETAPALRVNIVAANDIRDLMRREADIALRHVRPEQPDLIAKLVMEAEAGFYAAQSYVDRKGQPETINDLTDHEVISFGDAEEMIDYLRPMGVELALANFPVGSNNGLVSWKLCQDGFGVAIMSTLVAERTPGLVRILPDEPPIIFPGWLVAHRELHTSRKIRLVFDTLARHLSALK